MQSLRTIMVCALAVMVCAAVPSTSFAVTSETAPPAVGQGRSGLHDFDFLVGEWHVHHRRIQADTLKWVEFDGTCSNHKIMDGAANIEEHALNAPNGPYRAIGLRSYDPKTALWSIRWLDGRYPSGALDPPVRGRFENGVGKFYSDYQQDGKPMRGRLMWSRISSTSARWEQAASADGGKTWATNWIMKFERVAATQAPSPPLAAPSNTAMGVHGFDFLLGDWRVHHRYLRVKGDQKGWVDVDGTCNNRALMQGSANFEEHIFHTTAGITRAIALRSYDSKSEEWTIWWLDGRDPSGDMGPPVQGRFANGIGTFLGETTLADKPVRVRLTWSHITPTSALWEQAYSSDAGRTWETNWVMEFRRQTADSQSFTGGT
jgi:hypothetical protein